MHLRHGDKFCESLADHRLRWRSYRRQLAEDGFTLRDELYRLFSGEVFHDRPIAVDVSVSEEWAKLTLTNSYALNEVYRITGSRPPSSDFETRLSFLGLTEFSTFDFDILDAPLYRQSELGKDGQQTQLVIEAVNAEQYDQDPGFLVLKFSSFEISDLRPVIEKYATGMGEKLLSSTDRNPGDYE